MTNKNGKGNKIVVTGMVVAIAVAGAVGYKIGRDTSPVLENVREASLVDIPEVKSEGHASQVKIPKLEKPKLNGVKAGDRREIEIYPDVKVAFRWCPATGEQGFLMGSPASEDRRGSDEEQHKVVLSKGYWMQETEFTQGQWKAVMGSNPSWLTNAGLTAPVDQVSWDNIQECLKKLNGSGKLNTGVKAILPSEAQWEYACRAGTQTTFHYGNSLSSEQVNFDGLNPYGDAAEGVHKNTTVAVRKLCCECMGLEGYAWQYMGVV